jgi:hypothetical protein
MKTKSHLPWLFLLLILSLTWPTHADGGPIYLPLVIKQNSAPAPRRTVNAPFLNVADISGDKFNEMSVFWFGQVTPDHNYTDVRIGYNSSELVVHTATFDRRLWYNPSSTGSDLEAWDAATLVLDLNPDSQSARPTSQSYRFVSAFRHFQLEINYKAAYRGEGNAWQAAEITFDTVAGWRGLHLNDNGDDKGWAMTFRIPFASLGLNGPPPDGTRWGIGVAMHDRDSQDGPPQPVKYWPESYNQEQPATWGTLHFGLPVYQPVPSSNPQTVTIRHGLDGAQVPDGAVGGGTLCGDGLEYWSQWGLANYNAQPDFNIQNQADISDWPCFSKYYVTFPLSSIPTGKVIRSARLELHQFGGSDPSQATASLIQVFTIDQEWSEANLTWNNAPLAYENVGRARVGVTDFPGWPGILRTWDISGAVAGAYATGGLLRLALYSADAAMHSGKYFVSSDTGDWNAVGRPTLVVEWGEP